MKYFPTKGYYHHLLELLLPRIATALIMLIDGIILPAGILHLLEKN